MNKSLPTWIVKVGINTEYRHGSLEACWMNRSPLIGIIGRFRIGELPLSKPWCLLTNSHRSRVTHTIYSVLQHWEVPATHSQWHQLGHVKQKSYGKSFSAKSVCQLFPGFVFRLIHAWIIQINNWYFRLLCFASFSYDCGEYKRLKINLLCRGRL